MLDSIIDSMDMNLSKFWKTVEDRGAWHAAVHEVTKSWTLSNYLILPLEYKEGNVLLKRASWVAQW